MLLFVVLVSFVSTQATWAAAVRDVAAALVLEEAVGTGDHDRLKQSGGTTCPKLGTGCEDQSSFGANGRRV